MNWKKISEVTKTYSTGFFFGAILVFINQERINYQGIIVSIGAFFMLGSILFNEILKRKKIKNK